jgi:tetratricopeptide (TPR) repeat protein
LLASVSTAGATDPLALWHLASAADAPDEELAGRLEDLAARNRSRTGSTAASVALERAAWLTPDPARAASRRAEAAYDAFVGGDVARTRRLAQLVLDRDDAPEQARATAGFALGMLEQYAGSVPAAATLLARAAASAGDDIRVAVLGELAMTGFRLGDLATFDDCATRIAEVADEARADHRLWREFTGGVALVVRGDHDAGHERLRGVVALVPGLPERDAPLALLLLALSAGFVGDARPALATGEQLLAEVRRQGAVGMLVPALAIVAAGRAWLGDHAGAFADAGEAVELGLHLGYVADVAVAEGTLAWQLAARGRHREAAGALARARALTDRAGTTAVAAHLALTAAFCALCRDDPAGVVAELEPRLELDGGVGAMGEPLGVAPLLVEAYVALGRRDDAVALAGRLEAVTPASAPAPHRALCLRARGLVADDDRAVPAYEAALVAHAEAPEVFEHARTTLLLGQRLRRVGQRVRARELLREA